jgi:hypothetical protein
MPYQLACSFPVMAKDITGTGQVTDAGLVLRGAENPHLGGVHDADENRAIRAVSWVRCRAPWVRCRTEGGFWAVVPVGGQARPGTALAVQLAGAMASSRPPVSTLIRAHMLAC